MTRAGLTKRPFSSGEAYKSIWNEEANESPLMTITKAQTAKIKAALHAEYGDQVMVDFCMRYGNPSTPSKVREMVDAGKVIAAICHGFNAVLDEIQES